MRLEHWFYTLPLRFRSLFRRRRVEQDLADELQFHLANRTNQEIAAGRSPAEARYAALRALHGLEQRKEEVRDTWRVRWLHDLVQDTTYSLRTLTKTPGFTLIATLVLALGIGANAAVFTVVSGVLLRPLPFPEPDRLLLLSNFPRKLKGLLDPGPAMVDRDYLEFRRHNRSFETLATLGSSGGKKVTLTGRAEPAVLTASQVGPDFLRVLRVSPFLGRGFLPKEPSETVLLSHRLWTSRFAADPAITGKSLTLDGVSYSIAGVMPASFSFQNADLWIRDEIRLNPHNIYLLPVLGRLKPGVSLQQAQAEFATFAATLPRGHGLNQDGFDTRLLPLKELFVSGVRKLLLIFSGAVAFVFLIACANFANLLLIRGAARQPEIAVRAALGAGRGRLIRQLLTESSLLSLAGATLGLVFSVLIVKALLALLPLEALPSGGIHLDPGVLAFAFTLSLVTGLVFGLAPALQATRRGLREGVTESGRRVSLRRDRLRSALVTAEIALALVLLTGAGLLAKSFLQMRAVNPGFQTTNLVLATLDLPRTRYQTAAQMQIFDQRLLSKLAALPETESVAAVSFLPFGYGIRGDFQLADGRRLPGGFNVDKPAVSPAYFRTLRIPLLRGRTFTDRDNVAAPGVAVISQSLAKRFWPATDAVGQRISMEDHPAPGDWLTIIGVVNDVRQQGLQDKQAAVIYQPYQQMKQPGFLEHMSFVVRSQNPQALANALGATIRHLDPDLPTESITTMDAIVTSAMTGARSQTRLLGLFSLLALLLAAIGIYGVLACSVAERTHEIGIRMAVGAEKKNILWLILRRTLALTATGVLLGTLGALALTRVLTKLLFETTPTDPVTFLAVIALLSAVALVSAWIPARRATGVHPLIALRHQ